MGRSRGFVPVPGTVREVRLTARVRRELGAAAQGPYERCGGLLGDVRARSLTVTGILPCRNEDASADAFSLSLPELFQMRAHGGSPGELVGLYHGHPAGGTALSPLDIHYLSLYPWLWLIAAAPAASEGRPQLAPYIMREGTAQRLCCV